MSKPTLGRGLGDLLGANRTGAEPSAPTKPPGVGLRILIGGAQEPREPETKAAAPAPPLEQPAPVVAHLAQPKTDSEMLTRTIAALALIGADLALLGWAAHYVVQHPHALGFREAAICVGSILLAAMCGCVVVRLLGQRR